MTAWQLVFVWWCGVCFGWASKDPVDWLLRRLMRPLRCRLHLCGGRVTSSEYGIGWQCASCGRIAHWESWEHQQKGRREERRPTER